MVDIEKKIPVHIGLFGHIDSGKTAVAAVLSEFISTAGIDAHPQSKERGITIDLGFTSFVLDEYLITLVDGPGHADLIKISASSVEIIDCALIVIDVIKGPQIQTGEHLIMIESLNIKEIIVVLNKIDLFKGDLDAEVKKIKEFFKSTSYGSNIPIFSVSAKDQVGFEDLKQGILKKVKTLNIKRNYEGSLIIPIDHHFSIKGRGAVITGTILQGKLNLNQDIDVIPVNTSGRVKSIQIFHQNVNEAKAGDRVGVNIKGIDIKRVYRGCYATDNKKAFDLCDLIDIQVKQNKLFKHKTQFGTQVHVTIGMFTSTGHIFPYFEKNGKKIQLESSGELNTYKAYLWLNEKVFINKERTTMLLSRLDLLPTTLRILGAAELITISKEPPTLYKFKIKKGRVQNPEHAQGIVCSGLAQSFEGAKKLIGRKLEPPFARIIGTFGTKGLVIVGIEIKEQKVKKGDIVVLKELRSFTLKSKKDLNLLN
ncbi:MAG: GTP-binding protein [Candidatus Lokiarchaeota archaeon]|nr:GTP-binding protein [Candidatus Lokiarchaeota archaeon]